MKAYASSGVDFATVDSPLYQLSLEERCVLPSVYPFAFRPSVLPFHAVVRQAWDER